MGDGRRSVSAEIVDSEGTEVDLMAEAAPQYMTFVVASEVYGLPITCVAEIIGAQRFTPVPDARPFMRGVINLRGTVIPVMDVRVRLELERREIDDRTCIIVVQHNDLAVGLLVDTISDVIDVPIGAIEAAPRRQDLDARSSVVTGLVQVDGEVKILIDLERLLRHDESSSESMDRNTIEASR